MSTRRRSSRFIRRLSSVFESHKSFVPSLLSHELVSIVREKFVQKYNENPDFYDECDVNRVKDDNWTVQRFIEYQKQDPDKALEQLDTAMKWRKSYGINSRSLDNDFPKEIFNLGAIFSYNSDKNGNAMVYIRVKCNKKVPQLQPIIEQHFVAILNQIDIENKGRNYSLAFDLTGAGIGNVNMGLLQFFITTMRRYFPLGLQNVYVYNLPWILKNIWAIVKMWLGEYQNIVKFVNGDEINIYIDNDQLPSTMGGSCRKCFTKAPQNAKTLYEMRDIYGFTYDNVTKYLKVYADLLEEAKHFPSDD